MDTRDRPFHGGDLAAARRLAPSWAGAWLDLSTGINPWPYPVPRLESGVWSRLPDSGMVARALEAARSHYAAPPTASLVAAPGSQALIQWLPRLRPAGRVAILGPTYAEHGYCWARAGHDVGMAADPLDAADEADVVIVTNPNNPDGRVTPSTTLEAAASRLAARGGWLIVDEAFADLAPEVTLAPLADRPGFCVLRSLGKFFGLAGLRLGFLIAAPVIAGPVEAALGPWAVSGPALAVAAAALADRDWIGNTRSRLSRAAADLAADLAAHGCRDIGGTDLFRLVAHDRAEALFEALLEAGILVRRFPEQADWLRFGLPGDAEARDRLNRALAAF